MRQGILFLFFSLFFADTAFPQESADNIAVTNSYGSETEKDSMYNYNMGEYYINAENYVEAAKHLELAVTEVEKFSELYENVLNWLSVCYIQTKDQEGIARTFVLVDEHNRHELEKECNEPMCMKERAEYYMMTGDNAKSKECYIAALAMPMTDEEKAVVYASYARFLEDNDDHVSGSEYYHLAANAYKALEREDESYIAAIYLAAQCNFFGEQYEKAIDDYKEALEYFSNSGGEDAPVQAAMCHSGIGNALYGMEKYEEAAQEYQLAVNLYKEHAREAEEYPKAIENLANAEKECENYEAAIAHYKEAISIYKEYGIADEMGKALDLLNLCYAAAGMGMEHDEEAEEAVREARYEKMDRIIKDELDNLELNRKYLGEYIYANSLATIAGAYNQRDDYDNSVKYYRQHIDAIRDVVRDEFRLMSEKERMLLWNKEKGCIDDLLEMLTMFPEEKKNLYPELSAISYDAMLLSKGILLNSSIEFEKVLLETGNRHLQDVYKQIQDNETEIENLRQAAQSDAELEEILSLARENQALQLELYKGCAEYADFTDYISYKWQDVQQAMNDDDVAVEFTYIDSGGLEDYNYMVAIVMTKTDSPIGVKICNQTYAEQMEQNDSLYVKDEIGDSIWGKIEQYLNGKKRLFFSADGIFNNIGIEYLQYNGKPLSEQLEVYRLSSTKELCRTHENTYYSNVALFGGINYNGMENLSEEKEDELRLLADDAIRDMDSDVLANLKNSLHEVCEIEQICKDENIPEVLLFTAAEATEAAFRKLDNSKVNLLHIATHGRYKEVDKSSDADAMSNSILAFAGANVGGDNTEENDGIISAADVAMMNLRHCDLAVLSACETGLGKLGDDGVFGLQRGFKNAGIHSLLMTLKPISDVATTNLMASFYRYLMSGKSKREALSLAQQDLRSKGFTDANYWTTFILLDAIE